MRISGYLLRSVWAGGDQTLDDLARGERGTADRPHAVNVATVSAIAAREKRRLHF
jgi:hypothetical protein